MTAIAILQIAPVPAYFSCGWMKSPICLADSQYMYMWGSKFPLWPVHTLCTLYWVYRFCMGNTVLECDQMP